MASADGGWGAFDADNTSRLVGKLPFCDFGAVTDPPSADVTAHAVEALAAAGLAGRRAARRGVVWLLRAQEKDGSWFGRWGANYIYGTGAVVPALIAAGVRPGKPAIRRAVEWLEAHQNPDGGWGEDMRSYDDPSLAGRGASTASQTAWALLALLAAADGGPPGPSADARYPLARRAPAPGRDLGRARVHRHRVPRRLLPQLPPVPARLPGQRARPLPILSRPGRRLRRRPSTPGDAVTAPVAPAGGPPDQARASLLVCSPLRLEAMAVRRGLGGRAAAGPAGGRAGAGDRLRPGPVTAPGGGAGQ